MKRMLLATCFLFSTFSFALEPFGIGLFLGDPSAVSLAYRLGKEESLQAHVGWGYRPSRFNNSGLIVAVDYLHHFMSAIAPLARGGTFAPAVGAGLKLSLFENRNYPVAFGIRIPGKMSFFLDSAPVEIFAELALGLYVIPNTDVLADGGIGARWYF